jgi:hypothetical protein
MPNPEAPVEAQLAAYNRQDIEAFVACFHPDVEFIRWPDRVLETGHAAFRRAYTELWQRSPRLQARILDRMVVGRFVIDLEQLTDHADGPMAPVAVIYETQEGLIRRCWALSDKS